MSAEEIERIGKVLARGEVVLEQWRQTAAWLDERQRKRTAADRLPVTPKEDADGRP